MNSVVMLHTYVSKQPASHLQTCIHESLVKRDSARHYKDDELKIVLKIVRSLHEKEI
jgi:hypothetical protein